MLLEDCVGLTQCDLQCTLIAFTIVGGMSMTVGTSVFDVLSVAMLVEVTALVSLSTVWSSVHTHRVSPCCRLARDHVHVHRMSCPRLCPRMHEMSSRQMPGDGVSVLCGEHCPAHSALDHEVSTLA